MVRAIRFSIWFPVYVCWFLEIGIHSHVYNGSNGKQPC
jgi:hypothetical protein